MKDATRARVVVAFVAVLGGIAPAAAIAGTGTGVGTGAVGGGADPGHDAGADARGGDDVQCDYPLTVEDATGTDVTIEEDPGRIVTLAPSAAQTLWGFDASDQVVGVSEGAAYLAGAGEKTVVTADNGTEYHVDAIQELEPDVVIAPSVVRPRVVRSLRANGVTTYYLERANDFADLYAKTEVIGKLAGECGTASATVTDMRRRVEAIREAVGDEEKPGALYVYYGFTAGNETFVGEIMAAAGTENLAPEAGIVDHSAELPETFVADNAEAVEWLVLEDVPESQPTGAPYDRTTAIRENWTAVLDFERVAYRAPHSVSALETLTRAVHPEAYEEAQAILAVSRNATATATATAPATPSATATTSVTVATTDGAETTRPAGDATGDATTDGGTRTTVSSDAGPTAAPTTTGGAGTGFTAAVGVLALLVVALLVGRRR